MAIRYLIAAFFLFGCAKKTERLLLARHGLEKKEQNSLYVVSSDFTTGAVRRIDLLEGRVTSTILPAHADAVARWDSFHNQLLVLNRLAGNNLTLAVPDLSSVIGQIPLTESSNPQDILVLPKDEAFVSSYRSDHVRRLNLATGKVISEGVDLSTWREPNGFLGATYLHHAGNRILVTVQRLDMRSYRPTGISYLLPFDPGTEKVAFADVKQLIRCNPFTDFKTLGPDFFLGEVGILDRGKPVLDGGIERFDGRTLQSKGIVAEESFLGGDILDFEFASESTGLAIVGTPTTDLVWFDLNSGKKETVVKGEGFQFSAVVVDRERKIFYVTDRRLSEPAVRIFSFDGKEREENRIPLELPPFSLVLAP